MTDAPVKFCIAPPHAGQFIRAEILCDLHLTVGKAARILGVCRTTLSDLVNAKAALSLEMVQRIEMAFSMSMDTVLHMETWHDGRAMRQRAWEISVRRLRAGVKERPGDAEMIAMQPAFLASDQTL